VVLSGSGECAVEGATNPFGSNSTLVLEPNAVHQIVNASNEEMKLAAALSTAPVRDKTGAGEPLPVPWEAPENIA